MALVTKEFKLDLAPGQLRPVVNASQGDTGYTAKLRGKKPDKTVFEYTATVSGSSVTFSTTEQMTIISGQVECELVFSNSGDVIASANFLLIVEDSPYNPDALSESEVTSLADVVTDVLEENPALVPTANLAAAVGPYVEDWLDDNGAVVKTQSVAGFGHYDEHRGGMFDSGAWSTNEFGANSARARSHPIPPEVYAVSCTSDYSFCVGVWTDGVYTGYVKTNGTVSTSTSSILWTTSFDIAGLRGSYPSSEIRLLVKNSSGTTITVGPLTDAFTWSCIVTEDLKTHFPFNNNSFEFDGVSKFNSNNFVAGNMSNAAVSVAASDKSAAVSYMTFNFPKSATISANDGYRFGIHLLDNDGNFVSDPGWKQSYDMPAGQNFKIIVTNWPRNYQNLIDDATAQSWIEQITLTTEFQKKINPAAGSYHYFGERVTLNRNTYNCSLLFNTTKPSEITTGWQGSTVYDGKLFRLADTGMCAIYELGNSTALASFDLGSKASDNHANSCSFGAEKYSESSAFPMLYVTAGSGTQIKLVVEDIHENNGVYTSTQVQEITYDKASLAAAGFIDGWGWPCWTVDAEKGYLYTIGSIRQSSSTPNPSSDNTNKMVFNKFKIPDKSITSVTLTASDLLEQWTTPFEPMLTQGACYYNGYIFAVYGLGASYQNAVCVYDTVQRAMVARLDSTLNQDPLYNQEPEDCSVFDGKLIVSTVGNNMYSVEFI